MKNLLALLLVICIFGFFFSSCQNPNDPVTNNTTGDKLLKKTIWNVPGDFATIQDAIDDAAVLDGHTILVEPGNHYGAYVSKSVEIKGTGNAVINDGPLHPAGITMGFRLIAGSDGAKISHLTFTTDLSIMNGAAVNDVTVTQCTFLNSIQAISNWRGNGWNINYNTITDLRTRNGGGIGILVGDYLGGTVNDNEISHNTILGTLHVYSGDGGGYAGSGIVIYADFRWGGVGAEAITNNFVTHNSISMDSDNPAVVDINAFELTEGYYPDEHPGAPYVIKDNYIGFNDFSGTTNQILLSPLALKDYNNISRNLGNNRGQRLHPGLFKP